MCVENEMKRTVENCLNKNHAYLPDRQMNLQLAAEFMKYASVLIESLVCSSCEENIRAILGNKADNIIKNHNKNTFAEVNRCELT